MLFDMNFINILIFLIFENSVSLQCFQMILKDSGKFHDEFAIVTSKILREHASKISPKLALLRYAMSAENSFIHDDLIQKIVYHSKGVIAIQHRNHMKEEKIDNERFNIRYFYQILIVVDGVESFRWVLF